MNFIEELRWRGMIHDMTPGLEEFLNENQTKGYIGFDPTAPSLTIGNYVQIMSLTLFQRHGHIPVVLMGGATGRIGDPSGKDAERELKTDDEIQHNLEHQQNQFRRLLDFESAENKALLVNNFDFYEEMNVLDFLRDAGKTLTVNYMMSKESVKKRINTGLSFTEFSYQLLQGYDFQILMELYGIHLQMGGSDQWGNITSGTEFIRRNTGKKAYALTSPLLVKADGSKFGKSSEGNIWLDPELTTPYQFYQFWINGDDRDVNNFIRIFSLKTVEELKDWLASETDPRVLKRELAKELTIRIHGEEEYQSVLKVSEILFNHKISPEYVMGLSEKELESITREIPSFELEKEDVENAGLLDVTVGEGRVFGSNGEARRAIKGNAVSVNKRKIKDFGYKIAQDDLLFGKYILLENGKKNKYMVRIKSQS